MDPEKFLKVVLLLDKADIVKLNRAIKLCTSTLTTETTATYTPKMVATQLEGLVTLAQSVVESNDSSFCQHFQNAFQTAAVIGGATTFLSSSGLSPEDIATIQKAVVICDRK